MSEGDRETVVAEALRAGFAQRTSGREWWRGMVIYEVYVRSFRDSSGDGTGDLRGVLEKLDYIAELSVDGLWLSPFYPSPDVDFGYDITDHRNVDPKHGSMDDFLELLKAAHGRGLRLLLDFIPCHTSDQHRWFQESRSSRDNSRADWYVWADAAPDGGPPNNWLSSFGGSAWTWDPRRSQYYYHPFLSCQPALDLRKPEPLEAMIDQLRFWFDLGVDGVRIDAAQCLACDPDLRSNPPAPKGGGHVRFGGGPNNPFARQLHLFDRDVPEAIPVVQRFRQAVREYEPERVLIGELADMDSSRLSEKYTVEGERFHAVYDFDIINSPPKATALSELLARRAGFLPSGWLMNVFSNHDTRRAVSNLTAKAEAEGRIDEAAKMLMFMQLTLRGGAVIYQGDELGLPQPHLAFEQLRDPWGINLWPDFEGRDGARTPMPWLAGVENAGFTDGETPWIPVPPEHRRRAVDMQLTDPESCLRFARAFLAWRRRHPVVIWGAERVETLNLEPLIAYDRFDEEESVTFAINFSTDERWLPLEETMTVLEMPGGASERSERGLKLPPLGFAGVRAVDETRRPLSSPA